MPKRGFMNFLIKIIILSLAISCVGEKDDPVVSSPKPKAAPAPGPEVATDPFSFVESGVVSSNFTTSCLVDRAASETRCWGNNSDGQVGNAGTITPQEVPEAVSGGLDLQSVSVGATHTCGVDSQNDAYCWGADDMGQLGDDTALVGQTSPVFVLGNIRQVSAGDKRTCAITLDDKLLCWGDNSHGQLGQGLPPVGEPEVTTPTEVVVAGETFSKITHNAVKTYCAITNSQKLYCWGDNTYLQVGNGEITGNITAPEEIEGSLDFKFVSNSVQHTCAVTVDDDLYCWGQNDKGQLIKGSAGGNELSPFNTGLKVSGVLTGKDRTCYTTESYETFCAGENTNGILATGDEDNLLSPEKLSSNYKPVAMNGATFSLFVNKDGELYGAGDNADRTLATSLAGPFLNFFRVSDLTITP